MTGYRKAKNQTEYSSLKAELGIEKILGQNYGGIWKSEEDIVEFFDTIAVHPATAHHIAKKLVTHFVADSPDPKIVNELSQVWIDTGGDLMKVYMALKNHPIAQNSPPSKIKQPYEYIVSSFRLLAIEKSQFLSMSDAEFGDKILLPMEAMGQKYLMAPGPDGWPEDTQSWITPAQLAARIQWAEWFGRRFVSDADPKEVLVRLFGDTAPPALEAAIYGSGSNARKIALLLASSQFNRR